MVVLGDHNKNFICRRCLSSYSSENMLMLHKQKNGDDNITNNRNSSEAHIQWKKKRFHRIPSYIRIYSASEADNEKDNSSIGNKTTNIFKQIPVRNGYRIVSKLENLLKSGYNKSLLGYENVNWFVDEIIKLEKKWRSILKKLIEISLRQRKIKKIIEIIKFVIFVK